MIKFVKSQEAENGNEERVKMDKKTLEEVLEELDAGMCNRCEYDHDGCWLKCGEKGWEKETFIKWLKEQIKEDKKWMH